MALQGEDDSDHIMNSFEMQYVTMILQIRNYHMLRRLFVELTKITGEDPAKLLAEIQPDIERQTHEQLTKISFIHDDEKIEDLLDDTLDDLNIKRSSTTPNKEFLKAFRRALEDKRGGKKEDESPGDPKTGI